MDCFTHMFYPVIFERSRYMIIWILQFHIYIRSNKVETTVNTSTRWDTNRKIIKDVKKIKLKFNLENDW